MAVLNAADRRSMPKSDFAGPGRSFPIQDATHQRMAISGATRSEHAGNISPAEEERIKAEARAKLGKGGAEADPHQEHRAAVAKMDPAKLHQHMMDAAAGKHGPAAQQSAQQVMQPVSQPGEPDADDMAPPARRSPFSGDNDTDDQPVPTPARSMFSGGR